MTSVPNEKFGTNEAGGASSEKGAYQRELSPQDTSRSARLLASRSVGLACLLLALGGSGCMLHRTSSERLADAAHKLNVTARFGQIDTAARHASKTARPMFMERRKHWGDSIRVVDVNLAGINLLDEEHAEITVEYAWTRMDQGTLHATVVKQYWENPELDGWRLEREQRASGDVGLFGEPVPEAAPRPRRDVHFATKSLGAQ